MFPVLYSRSLLVILYILLSVLIEDSCALISASLLVCYNVFYLKYKKKI